MDNTANENTAVGQGSLFTCRGAQNTAIGAGAGFSVSTASNVIVIGANVPGANVTGSCFIGHIRGVATQHADAIPVVIDTVGQLGTVSSSRRFKKEIKAMEGASESVLALKPVMFRYKSDDTGTPQFGLIAEEVAEVNPVLVVRDENGEIYTVRYDAVNAMLLNEFLKEHRRVDQQENTIAELESTVAQQREDFEAAIGQQRKGFEATIRELKKGIESVTVRLNKQAAQIQNVNAQMEVSKPIARMAESCQYAVLLKKSGLGIRRESFSPGAFFLSSVMHCQGQPDREKGKNKYETTKYNSNLDPDGLRWAVAKTTSGRASAGRRLSWRQHGGRAERPFESHYCGLQHGSGFLVAREQHRGQL